MPSTVVGVALIGVWNRPGLLGLVYATDVMFLLLTSPDSSHRGADPRGQHAICASRTKAAAVSGAADGVRTMARIVLPQTRLGVAAAW